MKYSIYQVLQDYVHTGHVRQKAILSREFKGLTALNPRARVAVLELACGGGKLASVFPVEAYLGIDLSPDRIAAARSNQPHYRFEVCDVKSTAFQNLISDFSFIFCHGLLHHIDDQSCRAVLQYIQRLAPKPATFVAIEPILPVAWRNPLGFLLCKLDEGHYIRAPQHYQLLFEQCQLQSEYLSFFPRWPGSMEAYIARYP